MAKFVCTCTHEYQDEKYGYGIRVYNRAPKACGGRGGYRCTVCGCEKQGHSDVPSLPKKDGK